MRRFARLASMLRCGREHCRGQLAMKRASAEKLADGRNASSCLRCGSHHVVSVKRGKRIAVAGAGRDDHGDRQRQRLVLPDGVGVPVSLSLARGLWVQ